jgi:2-methylisocitrate lyase-like PEP mutase family enzyme
VIMARTDARGAVGGGMEEVLRRGRAYLDAGADVLYVEALQSRDEIRAVRAAFPDALLKVTPYAIDPPITSREVRDFRLCTAGIHITKIGAIAMYDFLVEYRTRGDDVFNEFAARNKSHPLGGFGIFDMTGFPRLLEMEQRYLPAETMARYEQSIGVYDPRVGHMGRVKSAAG